VIKAISHNSSSSSSRSIRGRAMLT